MGKKKVLTEQELKRLVVPASGDVVGVVLQLLGYDRVLVKCDDGYTRLCRIRGKLKRKVWIRTGDVVLVSPWDFQPETRGDIFWRYRKSQIDWLRKQGHIKSEFIA
ncbi:MAG: translation initiation factor eIF-1A [Candidatus Bathyarchaeia archaeon]